MRSWRIPTKLTDMGKASNLTERQQKARIGNVFFRFSIFIAVAVLLILFFSILDQSFGLVALVDKVDRSTITSQPIEKLSQSELITIIESNLSKNRVKTLDRDEPLRERSNRELLEIIENEVIEVSVVESASLSESLLRSTQFREKVLAEYPDAIFEFRSWINLGFISRTMSSVPEQAGVRTAILGSLMVILITLVVAFPLGVSAAIYLEEYAKHESRLSRIIQTNIDNLAGVPSIIYGILGLAIFVRLLSPITSGTIFGIEGTNGRTILSAGLTMALLVLPIIITNAQEAIRAVPNSLRLASYGLGATQWQTIWHHVFPSALPGILTGTILAISRALGETAPLIIVGAATYITKDPSGIFANFTTIPIQIYNWTTRPQVEFHNIAGAAILVLMMMLLSLNATAILWRNHINKNQ